MYKINWTNKAELSLQKVIDFILNIQQTNTYIDKIIKEIEVKENLISSMPFAGIKVKDFPADNLRKINVLSNFSLLYKVIDKSTIDIIYFWDNRQDPNKLKDVF